MGYCIDIINISSVFEETVCVFETRYMPGICKIKDKLRFISKDSVLDKRPKQGCEYIF